MPNGTRGGTAFQKLFNVCLVEFGGPKRRFAVTLGVTPSRLSHIAAGNAVPTIHECLRIARVTNVSASKVLRAAGHWDAAELIEDLFGPAAERRLDSGPRITPDEFVMVLALRRASAQSRRAIRTLIEAVVASRRKPKEPKRRRRSGHPAELHGRRPGTERKEQTTQEHPSR